MSQAADVAAVLQEYGEAWVPIGNDERRGHLDVQLARSALHNAARRVGVQVRTTRHDRCVHGVVVRRLPKPKGVPPGYHGVVVHGRSGVSHSMSADGLATRCGRLVASRSIWRAYPGAAVDCTLCLHMDA